MNKKSKISWYTRISHGVCTNKEGTHTRKINPKLGIMGFMGFLGFTGFLPKALGLTGVLAIPTFFLFFCFFGFFGFYYEGKMSDTLIDERFRSNANNASAIANGIALNIIVLVAIISVSLLRINPYDMLSLLIATIGLTFGLSIFLSQYLLYKFENEE